MHAMKHQLRLVLALQNGMVTQGSQLQSIVSIV